MNNSDIILRVEGLSKAFGDKPVLTDASFTQRRGTLKVLVGPSGGGKSTLLQCINYLIHPDQGRVWLAGREINPRNRRELSAYRQEVGMIFQDFNLFDHLNALENVRIALLKVKGMAKAEATARAQQELARVGLSKKSDLYPAQLSGGQKQRVSIARALAMDPKVLLLDEPTSALDPELIGEVLSVIKDLAQAGMTMIMATHQISFAAPLADEFLFMEKGRIVEHGSPAELLGRNCSSRTQAFCSKLSELAGDTGS
ncbi:MAG: amino acid ABC transporter ATP-binding protein [Thermodesulfobacteriota bacterium]